MTSLGDLPPIEKTSPPRQLAAGLARARDEAVQIAAAAHAEESKARIRAENFARRNASVESTEELRAGLAMFTELQEQNDVALASLATGTPCSTTAVHDDVETVQFSARLGASSGNLSWSCGTASLDLDMLELSNSSLSLSQELERSSAQSAQWCEPIPTGLAVAQAQ